MTQKVYTFSLSLTMKLMSEISRVDRFDATWSQIEKREGQSLKQLKVIATVRSTGASTRIEGSRMTDEEVSVLIGRIEISKLEERDAQEVMGYFEALDMITASYRDMEITESHLRYVHKILMQYSSRDAWHRGSYKQMSNAVEATSQDGTKSIIFQTTAPGLPTEEAMRRLVDWYHSDTDTLPIVRVALFIYEFLSIHPFQDGNGRMSRLLSTWLLLRQGYSWIQYVSFEHEIENRKAEYYRVLMQTQKQRPGPQTPDGGLNTSGESVDDWMAFFLDCLLHIQQLLMNKLETAPSTSTHYSPREKNILAYIENHPGCKSGEIAEKLNIPLPTVKKILSTMTNHKMIIKYGIGAGTNYIAEPIGPVRKDLQFVLSNANRKKEFLLMDRHSFIEIKKIILTPLFTWQKPDEWGVRFHKQQLMIQVNGINKSGASFKMAYSLGAYDMPHLFQPVFTLHRPVIIQPELIMGRMPAEYDYPINITIELTAAVDMIDFDVMFVYDER